MTVLLIAYKQGLNEGAELRYSLRSLEAHLHMPDLELVIVGERPPEWLLQDYYIHVPVDESLGKAANISKAVWKASRELQRSGVEKAIYLDDDYFLLDPTNSVMHVHGGSLYEHLMRCQKHLKAGHWFTEAMSKTFGALRDEMPNLQSFELHRPLPIDIDESIELLEAIQGREIFWRTWYGNMSADAAGAVEGTDGRYIGKSLPPGIPWVSSEDRAWSEWLGRKIAGMFSEPSRWEK